MLSLRFLFFFKSHLGWFDLFIAVPFFCLSLPRFFCLLGVMFTCWRLLTGRPVVEVGLRCLFGVFLPNSYVECVFV